MRIGTRKLNSYPNINNWAGRRGRMERQRRWGREKIEVHVTELFCVVCKKLKWGEKFTKKRGKNKFWFLISQIKTTLKIPQKRVRHHLFILMLHSLGKLPYFFCYSNPWSPKNSVGNTTEFLIFHKTCYSLKFTLQPPLHWRRNEITNNHDW